MPFDPRDNDSLGIGLMSRAADRQRGQRAQDMNTMGANEWNNRPIQNVLPFPQWDGFFQAMHEGGVDNMAGGPSPASLEGDPQTASNALMGLQQLTGHAGAGETLPPMLQDRKNRLNQMQQQDRNPNHALKGLTDSGRTF